MAGRIPSAHPSFDAEAKKLWREILSEHELSPARLSILSQACHALTRANGARQILEEAGSVTFVDRFEQIKSRPEIAIEHNARLAFNKLIQSLYLDESGGDPDSEWQG